MEKTDMFRELETERLHLKNIGYDDTGFFFWEFSNDGVNRYLYDAEPCASEDEAREWISFYLADEPRNQHRWILILKETGEKIGTCGFHCRNRETGEVEMGYDLLPLYWRKGYATEALKKIAGFAFAEMGVKSIVAHISVDNTASRKTAEKLGFVHTGMQYFEEFRGKRYSHDIYALSREGYEIMNKDNAVQVQLGEPQDIVSWMELVREVKWNSRVWKPKKPFGSMRIRS